MLAQTPAENPGLTGSPHWRELRDFPEAGKKPTPPRVLVVDDEPLVCWSLAETLGASGYEVIEAGDSDSAVWTLMDPPGVTDAVLLDLRLPQSDDLSVLAAMRRLAPSTPIILMSAYATPEIIEEARHLGAFTVIQKPFDMNEVAPLVARALAARPN